MNLTTLTWRRINLTENNEGSRARTRHSFLALPPPQPGRRRPKRRRHPPPGRTIASGARARGPYAEAEPMAAQLTRSSFGFFNEICLPVTFSQSFFLRGSSHKQPADKRRGGPHRPLTGRSRRPRGAHRCITHCMTCMLHGILHYKHAAADHTTSS